MRHIHVVRLGWPTDPMIYTINVDRQGHQEIAALMLKARRCPCCTKKLDSTKKTDYPNVRDESSESLTVFHWECQCEKYWHAFLTLEDEWKNIKAQRFPGEVCEPKSPKKSTRPSRVSLTTGMMTEEFRRNLTGYLIREGLTGLTARKLSWWLWQLKQRKMRQGIGQKPTLSERLKKAGFCYDQYPGSRVYSGLSAHDLIRLRREYFPETLEKEIAEELTDTTSVRISDIDERDDDDNDEDW